MKQTALLEMLLEVEKICTEQSLPYHLAYGTALGAVRHKGFIPWDADIDIMVDIDHYDRVCSQLKAKLPERYCVHSADSDRRYEELFVRIGSTGTPHLLLHIDIYPMVGTPRSVLGQWFFRTACYMVYRSFFVKRVPVHINYRNNPPKRMIARLIKLLLLPIPESLLLLLAKKLSHTFPMNSSDMLYNLCGTYGRREMIPKSYLSAPNHLEFEGHPLPVPSDWQGYLTQMYGNYMIPRRW